ncbi:hypothetical protein TTHERM_000522788 (macronuclear) [Tetrahymena thermophila SB210]|uniref:Uncharacterized protein n=1 Tax=Tetrahymena thermophila (strain SB210) TaxID=312017 RepID=W7XII8_TETTS|nr:hypothetical protein TTHERM_000522788 [Tetrahymena thermophila SB210]EWS74691.1 hypothetical protein TTHERM_000522788 [Tetrahymena thermophila SB210]|eukprot:XP_012652781.1 hypothetical protein TTHERM_000522788 [Tetrahymena thermophila SB210]
MQQQKIFIQPDFIFIKRFQSRKCMHILPLNNKITSQLHLFLTFLLLQQIFLRLFQSNKFIVLKRNFCKKNQFYKVFLSEINK